MKNVLLIDDSPIDRKIIRMTLERKLENIVVFEVDNGFDIINKIKQCDIHLCILDVMMPNKNGFEVLQEIKRDPLVNDVPVIICTGAKDNEFVEKALSLGAYDFFAKPLNGEVIRISLPLKVKNAINLMKKNQRIKYLSYRDILTGAYNRRFFEEEIIRIESENCLPLTIIMCDINGLKLINDTFGKNVGDEILLKAYQVIHKNCNEDDVVARWGGDEFVILIKKSSVNQAEDIIRLIQQDFVETSVNNINISMCFGIETKQDLGTSLNSVIKNAEDMMHRNKMMVKESARSRIIDAMINTLHEKNIREEKHSKRVSELCVIIGEAMGLSDWGLGKLKLGGLLHDIGKIALNEEVLNKPGKLNAEEWEQIKGHPSVGYRILSESEDMREIAEIALCHHERWDGNGYPKGLKNEQIPKFARIVAIADTYDAITSMRTYRTALSKEEAISEIINCSGTQFDPEIVEKFVGVVDFMGISEETG